jgi:hypothetical protein
MIYFFSLIDYDFKGYKERGNSCQIKKIIINFFIDIKLFLSLFIWNLNRGLFLNLDCNGPEIM